VPLVSLCMIMKNEEDELPIVLASALGMVDEIVIYDTGSSDRSIALARELGATVIEGHWDDDFSRARNVALSSCSGEWVLWLDADEAVHGDAVAFREQLRTEQLIDAYLVPIESIEGTGLGVRSAFHAARVFRREVCHWRGRLHEQIARRDDDSYPATRISSPLRILHRGYTALKWDAKRLIERNLQIAKSALEDPSVDHSLALFDFGRTLTETADPRAALAPLREAAATTSLATVRRTALRNIFYVHLQCGEFDEAAAVLDELKAQLSDPIGANVLLAKLLLWRGEHEACLEAVERLPFSATDEDGVEFG
jgi:glycosyltransferase involved in cell wall biosynthesis